jgi:excisionase family DNA binding protein
VIQFERRIERTIVCPPLDADWNREAKPMKETHGNSKLGWTLDELARSLSVSVPFLRLEIKRGKLRAAHLGRRVVLLDTDVRRYLEDATEDAH